MVYPNKFKLSSLPVNIVWLADTVYVNSLIVLWPTIFNISIVSPLTAFDVSVIVPESVWV